MGDNQFEGWLKVSCVICKAEYEIYCSIKEYHASETGSYTPIYVTYNDIKSQVSMDLESGNITLKEKNYPLQSMYIEISRYNPQDYLIKQENISKEIAFTAHAFFKKVEKLRQDRKVPNTKLNEAAIILCEFDALPSEKKLCRSCLGKELAMQNSKPKYEKRCPNCSKNITDDINFCPDCGQQTRYVKYCHQCKTTVFTKYCPKCGEQILL